MVSPPGPVEKLIDASGASAVPAPDWLHRPAPHEAEPAPPLKPSSALSAADAEARPTDGPFLAEAAAAGRLAHLLLQVLPDVASARRADVARSLAARAARR